MCLTSRKEEEKTFLRKWTAMKRHGNKKENARIVANVDSAKQELSGRPGQGPESWMWGLTVLVEASWLLITLRERYTITRHITTFPSTTNHVYHSGPMRDAGAEDFLPPSDILAVLMSQHDTLLRCLWRWCCKEIYRAASHIKVKHIWSCTVHNTC